MSVQAQIQNIRKNTNWVSVMPVSHPDHPGCAHDHRQSAIPAALQPGRSGVTKLYIVGNGDRADLYYLDGIDRSIDCSGCSHVHNRICHAAADRWILGGARGSALRCICWLADRLSCIPRRASHHLSLLWGLWVCGLGLHSSYPVPHPLRLLPAISSTPNG